MASWTIIKLELGRTDEFPYGSSARTYLMRLPLGCGGTIDQATYACDPRQTTVRRFWPQQPDRSGHLLRKDKGWAFSFAANDSEDPQAVALPDQSFTQGDQVILNEPGFGPLPFHIVSAAEETSGQGHCH